MEFPDRKSKKLERAMIMFKKDLNELQLNHKAASDEILEKIKQLLDSNGEDITILKIWIMSWITIYWWTSKML
jgi:hypothetical protein